MWPPDDFRVEFGGAAQDRAVGVLEAVERLRAVRSQLRENGVLDRGLAAWLAGGIARYLASAAEGVTLDAALGVETTGGRPWWVRERRAAFEDAIRSAAAQLGNVTPHRAADLIATRLRIYTGGVRWRRDRRRGYAAPDGDSVVFSIAMLCDGTVPSARTVQRALEAAPQG